MSKSFNHSIFGKASKFNRTIDNIRTEKIVLTPIWACKTLIWAENFYWMFQL